MEVRVGIDQRIIAYFYPRVLILQLELLGGWLIVRGVIGGVVLHVSHDLHGQYFRQLEG